jgi:Flp pilus assembly protein TadG
LYFNEGARSGPELRNPILHGGKRMKVLTGFTEQARRFRRGLISSETAAWPLDTALRAARRRLGEEEGAALVEFALIAPLMLMLTSGIFIFGIAMNNYLVLTQAVSVAARTLAANGGITLDPCATAYNAVTAAAPNLTPSKLTLSMTLNGVAESGNTCSSSSTTTGAAGDLAGGTNATLTVTYPCVLVFYGNASGATGCTLTASDTELVQ